MVANYPFRIPKEYQSNEYKRAVRDRPTLSEPGAVLKVRRPTEYQRKSPTADHPWKGYHHLPRELIRQIIVMAREGGTVADIARSLKLSRLQVNKHWPKFSPSDAPKERKLKKRGRARNTERNREILNAASKSLTLDEAGEKCGVSRERVRQVLAKAGLDDEYESRKTLISDACWNIERQIIERLKPPVLSTHPLHSCWRAMLARCLDPEHQMYKNYGGRGITVCERWQKSFQDFADDMGPKPTPKHSIDRKDNDSGYSKENCRWATQKQQCNNRRIPKRWHVTINGVTYSTHKEAAKKLGIKHGTLIARLRAGKTGDDLIFGTRHRVSRYRPQILAMREEGMTLRAIGERLALTPSQVRNATRTRKSVSA
jgi:DNA-binding CsgD family transcriptional regulator